MFKSKLIYDQIHGYMNFEPTCLKIIDNPIFQRLRDIKQLGLTHKIFPSATHNRFQHSLGVAYLSEKLLVTIRQNQPELNISDKDILNVKIAGLVHDLGHACLSHFFDNMFLKDSKSIYKEHENRSILLLEYIVSKYNITELDKDDVTFIKNLLLPDKNCKGYMYQIVSNSKNGLDTDKFDYICRDSMNLGLSYSFDSSRILMQARVINNELCYPEKEVFSIYEMYHTRYRLHKQIYTHPGIQQLEYMYLEVLNEIDLLIDIKGSIDNVDKFIKITDNIFDSIKFIDDEKYDNAKKLMDRIHHRKLYKFIEEINLNIDENINNKLLELKKKYNSDKYIIHKSTIGYTSNNKNPVDNVSFYKSSEPYKSYNLSKEKVSKLIPNIFQETIIRIFEK